MKAKSTVIEVLAAIIAQDYDGDDLFRRSRLGNVPIEYFHVIMRGLVRDRAKRIQSVAELEDALNKVRDGWIPVQCHVTFGKRAAHGLARWIENNINLYTYIVFATGLLLVAGAGFGVWRLVRAFF